MKKLVKTLNGAMRQIHLGMNVNFQEMKLVDSHIEGTISCEYAGTTNTMTLEITEDKITILNIHVIEKEFPFINVVVGFEEYVKGLEKAEDVTYYKDEQNYVYSGEYRLFTAGIQYVYQGPLTEVGLLERIRRTILFSYDFGNYLEKLVHKRPKKIRDEQVSESVRYLIIRDALITSNSIKDREPIEKDHTWELMNTFTITGKKGKQEIPVILSFGRKDDEMAAEVLIDAKKKMKIEVYQQGAISLALQCSAEKIDFSDEYIKDENGTYFKYKIMARHGYSSAVISRFIENMAKVAANLVTKI